MLCLATGPSSMTTEIPISCTPPHLLQETTIPYRICELFAVDVTASPNAQLYPAASLLLRVALTRQELLSTIEQF